MSEAPSPVWYVYVLLLADGRYYTGITQRLEERVREHQAGRGPTITRMHLPVTLLWYEVQPDAPAARRLESWFKHHTRAEKEAYMREHGTRCTEFPE